MSSGTLDGDFSGATSYPLPSLVVYLENIMPRTAKSRFQLGFDHLEDRSVPATGLSASLANGQLSILGTEGDDVITVRHLPAQFRTPVQLRIDGINQTFDPTKISKIVVQSGEGNDTISMIAPRAAMGRANYSLELWGGAGDDTLTGSLNADRLFGGAGNDVLRGGSGNDLLDGGEGDDQLYGEAGADTLFGDAGNDRMYGGDGGDNLVGGSGDDYYQGNYGLDYYIESMPGNETIDDNPQDRFNRVYQWAGANHPLAAYDMLQDGEMRASVRAFALDGQFSRQDVMNLFAQVYADGVVSENEYADLQTLSQSNWLRMPEHVFQLHGSVVQTDMGNLHFQGEELGQLHAGSSAEHLDKLIRKWFLGQDHPETLNASHTYQYAQGSLFGSKNVISPMDIRAGYPNIMNTNMFASMMTVAQNDPNAIRNLFINNGDGTFTVKLFDGSQTKFVTVDRYLPADAQGKLVYGQQGVAVNNASNILWPALLEKAIAQAAESGWLPAKASNTSNAYSSIDGNSGNSLWAGQIAGILTGRSTSVGNQITPDSLADLLDAYQSKEMVTVASNYPPNCGVVSNANVAIGRYYTILSYSPAKGGSFKLIAATGSGISNDVTGRTVPGIITLTTADFLANMQYYDTTLSAGW